MGESMFSPENYSIISELLPRLLGMIYLFAFFPFLFQIKGLMGKDGILPVASYLHYVKKRTGKNRYYNFPTLFWFNASDSALISVVIAGAALSILLMCGIFPTLLLFCLIILYLSIITVGQDFLGFGWEVLLQEVAIYTLFLSLTPIPNQMLWLNINFLLFRFYIQSGAVKLQSRDKTWANLTAIGYHYESQPIPNTVAWYIHKLPMWFHKLSCVLMFAIELVAPYGIFFDESIRIGCFVAFLMLQLFIWMTGNFSYLNYLSLVLSCILLNNQTLELFNFLPVQAQVAPFGLDLLLSLIGTLFLIVQLLRLYDHFFPTIRLRQLFQILAPIHIANRYGIFAVMTTTRYEVVLEGSNDGINWKEYLYRYKPSELTRRPRRISPYQPRLDWQAWFLPFRSFQFNSWYHSFIEHVLHGSPSVLKLLRHNPFPEQPPRFLRSKVYIYTFTSCKEKKETGRWWNRAYVTDYGPVCSLKDR